LNACIIFVFVYVVNCQKLNDVENGNVDCSFEKNGVPSYEDTCNITCKSQYVLTGNATRICLSNGSWSGIDGTCKIGKYSYVASM